jgi:hypothetical protein
VSGEKQMIVGMSEFVERKSSCNGTSGSYSLETLGVRRPALKLDFNE